MAPGYQLQTMMQCWTKRRQSGLLRKTYVKLSTAETFGVFPGNESS